MARSWKFFIASSAVILILTAAAKLFSLLQPDAILNYADPLLNVTNRRILQFTSLLEISGAIVLLMASRQAFSFLVIWTISAQFVLYRVLLWQLDPAAPCACLGRVGSWLPISERGLSLILGGIALYMFLGSSLGLLRLYLNRVRTVSREPVF